MKKILLPLFVCMSISSMAQNSMLKNPVKGAVNSNKFDDIFISSNGKDAVLFAVEDSIIYAIDIADNNAANASVNAITTIPDFVKAKLDPAAGQATFLMDMEVNPLSKSLYVLVMNMTATERFILKVEKNGTAISMLDLKNVTYSKLSLGNIYAYDLAFGNNTLYVSAGGFSLDGELNWMAAPFTHNAAFTKRKTTFFKSNQGGAYLTTAPLEKITIGSVDGKDRIMGVTTCAPGFSVELAKVAGAGLLSITEDFNVHQGTSTKVAYMHNDKKDWLFNHHGDNLYRIGKKYIDGSQVTANKINNNSTKLRDISGNIPLAIPADDMKLVANNVHMMAYWDRYRLVVLETSPNWGETGALKMLTVSTETPPPAGLDNPDDIVGELKMYPNPVKDFVLIELPVSVSKANMEIVSMEGRIVHSQGINSNKTTIDVSKIPTGMYRVNMMLENDRKLSAKLIIE